MQTKTESSLQLWQDADLPCLCELCIGENKKVRMLKEKFGSECKVCLKPYTTFRWCPGAKMRYRKTLICPTCAAAKNVCQACIMDLKYRIRPGRINFC